MIRGIGLRSAVAINIATMVGAGPLITIPLVMTAVHGSISLWPWIAGALIALCDGLTYCELASRFPRSGGTYTYLREAFGTHGPGRLAAFVFIWQLLFVAPLFLASGYIGFAQYAAYLIPALGSEWAGHAVAVGVGIVTLLALYRTIPNVARTGLILGAVAVVTLAIIAVAGFTHPTQNVAALVAPAFSFGGFGIVALGGALIFTVYDYSGYNDVTQLGDEVVAPVRTLPRSIVIAIAIVAVLYATLNLGVFSVLSPSEVMASTVVASAVIERALGHGAANVVTVLILITAFASTFGLLLGWSRVPYAAARDGDFLPAFGRLHPTKHFPHIALLAFGLLALPASLFHLDTVINVLTASFVLVQGFLTNVAVIVLRRRSEAPPFRMPLYPLPAILAGLAWLFLFWSSGTVAMLWALATLVAGVLIFFIRARSVRAWPFAALIALAFALHPPAASAATFTHARIVQREGTPQLLVDGKPFFFFGGAFFYERIPPERWKQSMLAMRAAGVNTLDLYVPWNWHETSDGAFDFDGHTNPRRNLRRVLALARELHFHLIVRPGPVIRNEWRNGGYPQWLLERPAYGMPLHDVLEGRYPATATLQNAHSDDAAAEWMHNAVHRKYAARWLRHALNEFVPYADLVIAVALDDDQGAYIDNQTWPAPHLHAYLHWLDAQVRSVTGPAVPTFINTYDMKVPASSPFWAMSNWYQSDAYAIGDHDRVELDFATATLTTQEHVPLATSEFQAGWLAQPEDPLPRAADPANTTLALAEMVSWGTHGVVDFPLQDTLAPFGWEAPFSNAFYSWDAAIPFSSPRQLSHPMPQLSHPMPQLSHPMPQLSHPMPQLSSRAESRDRHNLPSRWYPTQRFGNDIARYGTLLAATHRVATIAIADEVSASNPATLTNDDVAAIAEQLKNELRTCNDRGLTCDVVDLRLSSTARLRSFQTLVVPPFVQPPSLAVAARLKQLRTAHERIVAHVPSRRGSGITVLAGRNATFGIAVNWSNAPRRYSGVVWTGTRTIRVHPFTVPARDARIIVLAGTTPPEATLPPFPQQRVTHNDTYKLNAEQSVEVRLQQVASGMAVAIRGAAFGSGAPTITLANAHVFAVFAPDGGARLVLFGMRGQHGYNAVNATGALRDDVLVQPPPSTTDRIAKYTHSYPAGTFNRPYRADLIASGSTEAVVRFSYTAPDLGGGAHFEKTVRLSADASRLVVDERVTFDGTDPAQRAVTLDAIAARPADFTALDDGFTTSDGSHALAITWNPAAVGRSAWTRYGSNGTLMLVAASNTLRTTYALAHSAGEAGAQALERSERDWLAANPNPP